MGDMRGEPFFLPGEAGALFALYLPARGACRGGCVFLPPFAEEMNRCRATVAQQARALAELGYACLLLDPYGTGDSAGALSDASWDIWSRDVGVAASWLEARCGAPISLWGLRLGALLAAHAANREPGRFSRLLLWQPVQDGKLFLTQYLRLRVAFLMDREMPPETTDEMRAALARGETLEVAGYLLSGRLAADLDAVRMSEFGDLKNLAADWYELVAEAGKPVSPASQKSINHLMSLGCRVETLTFTGPPLWQLHKRDDLPELVAVTTARMKELA